MPGRSSEASYYRARYYDASGGRFLSEDPIRYAGGDLNFYPYALSNPGSLIDPLGLATVTNNTGVPILMCGNPGMGHGSGGQVYAVVPPDGKTYGGVDNPLVGYATPQDAIDAYYRRGPLPKPAGNIYDVDFYCPAPLTSSQSCSKKILGDDQGPHYTLKKDKKGRIVDSFNPFELLPAALRRIEDDYPWLFPILGWLPNLTP